MKYRVGCIWEWFHRTSQGKKQNTPRPAEQGQALVEYALILVLVVMGLAAILSLTGNAVGNVFRNVFAEMSDMTMTPVDPMSESEFWGLVTAVASYTPEVGGIVTNTPPPNLDDMDEDGRPDDIDNCK